MSRYRRTERADGRYSGWKPEFRQRHKPLADRGHAKRKVIRILCGTARKTGCSGYYERRKIMKKIAVLLLAVVAIMSITACGGKKADSSASSQSSEEKADAIPVEESWETIATPYGDLRYPANIYQEVTRTEGTENGIYSMKFSSSVEGKTYDLFTLYIGGEVGDATYLGKLTGKDGSENEVYVLAHDLGDLSGLDAQQQDKIYAMQEALNEVLGE